ncbi:unnamed protein product [Dracunculus medinensis]|uniref:G_PROTEIN_RECEP_F1_2 domain-containing protein n=1 Tax=Dracunculus medinensis TaxID=318479 RepID=A0A0N4UD34_DRAME|nr:unnamed protein product [Dracunculus medinensis]
MGISLDRFTAILFVFNANWRITKRRALILVAITWIFSTIMAAPLFYVNQIKRHDGYDTCEEYGWQYLQNVFGDGIMHTYGSLVFALQYCFPLTVLVISYTAIGLKMWNSAVPGDRTSSRYVISGRHESVKKMIRMVLLVSALYAGCWLPQNLLINILLPYNPAIVSNPRILYF